LRIRNDHKSRISVCVVNDLNVSRYVHRVS
jgi:hypothetical protein